MSPTQLGGLLLAGLQPSITSVHQACLSSFPSRLMPPALSSADLQAELRKIPGTAGPAQHHMSGSPQPLLGWLWGSRGACMGGASSSHSLLSPEWGAAIPAGTGSSCPTLLLAISPPAVLPRPSAPPAAPPSGSSAGLSCPVPFFLTFTFFFLFPGPFALTFWTGGTRGEVMGAPPSSAPCCGWGSLTWRLGGRRRWVGWSSFIFSALHDSSSLWARGSLVGREHSWG